MCIVYCVYVARLVHIVYTACIVCIVYSEYVADIVYIVFNMNSVRSAYNVYDVCTLHIVYIANIASFTKQVQNSIHATKLRQADSKSRSAWFSYSRNHAGP